MPDIPVLYAQNPLAISAVYSKIWIQEVVISAPEIGGDAEARIMLRLFRTTADGVEEAPAEPLRLHVTNLLSAADEDNELAAVVMSLMTYINKIGVERGVISPAQPT